MDIKDISITESQEKKSCVAPILLDVRQLACPLPILRAKNSLSQMPSGQVIRVVATDRGAPKDVEEFCRQTGNELFCLQRRKTASSCS